MSIRVGQELFSATGRRAWTGQTPARRGGRVLVIGGGIAAILCLRRLIEAGFDARAVVGARVGGEQTLASQRYLHMGSFYTNPELIALLKQARDAWRILFSEADLRVVGGRSFVGFVDEVEALGREEIWRANGLRFGRLRAYQGHPFLSGRLRYLYRMTDEAWIADRNPARILSAGLGGRIIRSRATQVEACGGTFRVYAGNRRRAEVLSAEAIVLAAGAGNQDLIAQLSTEGGPRQQVRRCQVLELSGSLPFASLLCPSSGHFIVPSGRVGGRTTWKCTYEADPEIESAGSPIDPGRYVRQRESLASILPFSADPTVTSTITSADKVESWDLGRGKRPDGYFAGEVVPGAWAIWPTKLTLAPLAANVVVESISRALLR